MVVLLMCVRFGSVGAAWRSTHAPTWVMCSLKRPLTHGAKRWQTAWERLRSGWMNTRRSTTIEAPTHGWWVCTDGVSVCMLKWYQTRAVLWAGIVAYLTTVLCNIVKAAYSLPCLDFTNTLSCKIHTPVQTLLSRCAVKAPLIKWHLGYMSGRHPRWQGSQGIPVCDYHLSMSLGASGCHPPVLDRVRAVQTQGVPCLFVCVCVRWPVCDSVVKRRSSLNTDQVSNLPERR